MHPQCLAEKFFHKVHLIWLNKEELGISDSVMEKIKNLKIETKKTLIKSAAEIETLAVDIVAKLWEKPSSSSEIDALIDKKYSVKKDKAKALVKAYISLEKMLNDEQEKKLKSLCKGEEPKEERSCCR